MDLDFDPTKFFIEANNLVDEFQNSLPSEIDISEFQNKTKPIFGIKVLQSSLQYRLTDLSKEALCLYDKQRIVPAFLLTRAAMETSAMFFWLIKKVKEAIEKKTLGNFFEFVLKATFGTRDNTLPFKAFNAQTAIDHVAKEKEFDDFRIAYDSLSEFCHPNFAGTQAPYSWRNPNSPAIEFGMSRGLQPYYLGATALFKAVGLFKLKSIEIDELLPKFIEVCEHQNHS